MSLPKVGTYSKPDPEKIALLRPDLVIVERTAASLEDRLSALGIQCAQVKIGSFADVYSMIQEIGAAAGAAEKAESLDQQIRSRLEAIRSESAGAPKPTVLMIVGRTPGLLSNLIAVGTSTYLSELLQIARQRLRQAIVKARARQVHYSSEGLHEISRAVAEAGVRSLRADLATLRAAAAHAALNQRLEIDFGHPFHLCHRFERFARRPAENACGEGRRSRVGRIVT